MDKKQLANLAVNAFKKEYPNAKCSLDYKDPVQLLIATRLAAQCTDARVNLVTPELFKKFKSVDDFAKADVNEIEKYIKSCGFYHVKAHDIVAMCKMLKEKYFSIVPDTIEELIKLPGVGRKTANLIIGDVYNKPAVVVDTHCIRITRRLGFHDTKNAVKIEKILREVLPPNESNDFCHRLVLHGRAVCRAISPRCDQCCMKSFCGSVTLHPIRSTNTFD
ncbi:MAG: Endonuclease III [Eubacteriales bacterium SKADARSKE-1]|nr:Endonuclease III [Eubacteriales bacterium SKADARSKE-1]